MIIQKKIKIILLLLLVIATCLVPSRSYAAQQRRAADDRREFASFVDGFFAGIRRDWHVPGMAFIAVRDGEVLYKSGYGHTDADASIPVSPDATMFRVGSVSKLVTSMAVLQLAEKERLLLDDDVNVYLRRSKLPQTFEAPITIRHLLTHTGGLDYKELELCARTEADERNFATRLSKIMPTRHAPPGKYFSYSNMGYALLGSIVERYSRQSFPSAVKKHIFQPLGMNNSTFSPAGDEIKNLAVGYDRSNSPVPYVFHYDLAAVGMSATAHDMGRFMLAQLGGGALGRNRVLSQMYADSMLRTHFTPHPRIDGTGLGYMERRVRGMRTMQVKGNMDGYSSFLMLIPEKKFGLFFAANISGLDFSDDLASAVIDRFFPPVRSPDIRDSGRRDVFASDLQGYYRSNKISRHTAEKAVKMFDDQIRITADDSGLLLSHTRGGSAGASRWVPSGDPSAANDGDLFVGVDESGKATDEFLFFQRGDDGGVATLVVGGVDQTYDRLRAYEAYNWQLAFIASFAAIFVVSLLGTLVGVTVNKGKLPWEKGLRAMTELWAISTIFCFIQAAFVVGLLVANRYVGDEFAIFVPYQVKALFVIPLAGALLLAWFWFRIFGNVFNPDHHWAEKLLLLAIACGETGYLLYLANWQLLGFMF